MAANSNKEDQSKEVFEADRPEDALNVSAIAGIAALIVAGLLVSFYCPWWPWSTGSRALSVCVYSFLPHVVIGKCCAVTFLAFCVAVLFPYIWLPHFKRATRSRAEQALVDKVDDVTKKAKAAETKAKEAGEGATGATAESRAKADAIGANTESQLVAEAKRAAEEASKAQTELDEFSRIWPKLAQPEYAIGLGLISKADYDALVSTNQNKSTLVIGLVFPAFLVTAMLLIRIGGIYPRYAGAMTLDWFYVLLGGLETTLFLGAADLKHKFEMSSQAMIVAAYAKMLAAKKSQSGDKSKSVSDQITEALKAASILKKTGLKIVPGDAPLASKSAGEKQPITPETPTDSQNTGGPTNGQSGS